MDVRSSLQEALKASGEGQRALLARLSSALAQDHQLQQALFGDIAQVVAEGREAQSVAWAASEVELALRPQQARQQLAAKSIGAIGRLLASSDHSLEKVGLECFANSYPTLFRNACDESDQRAWASVIELKTSALRLWRTGGTGAKTGAIKVIQRIIQTQTRGPADPRRQRTAEPNLAQVRTNHPFLRVNVLEDEANKLVEESITALFTCAIPDVVSALATSLTSLVKARPAFTQLVVTALTNWSPGALASLPNHQVRSVEKAVRVSVVHLHKNTPPALFEPYNQPVTEFLQRQSHRMDLAATEAKQQRERKRQLLTDDITESVKRRRIEDPTPVASSSSSTAAVAATADEMAAGAAFESIADANNTPHAFRSIDVTSLPLQTVVELLVATLQGQSDTSLAARIADARRAFAVEEAPLRRETVKAEPVDQLKVDVGPEVDDEVLHMAPPVIEKDENMDDDEDSSLPSAFPFQTSSSSPTSDLLVAPSSLSGSARTFLIESAVRRICAAGTEGAAPAVWVPLVSRLITRGLRPEFGEDDEEASERREILRKVIYEFVVEDMQSRLDFARLWLNEEWYVDPNKDEEPPQGRLYDRWLRRLLEHILQHSSNKDKAFTQFIVDLPAIPNEEIGRFGEMCTNPEQVQLGFAALRDLAVMRPPVRQAALDVLLSLTTHPDKLTRNAAINTVKRWVPDVASLSTKVLAFSTTLLDRLATAPPPPPPPKPELAPDDMAESDDEAEEEVKPRPDALVRDGEVIDGLPPAETVGAVVQHVELFFALSVKHPDLLDHLFERYSTYQPFAQESIHELITPLIKTLGVASPKLLTLIASCPLGSEPLVLRVLTILADKSRLPKPVVQAVRALATKREGNLNPRFLVLVIGECEKQEMFRYIPKIVTLLNNSPEEKLVVRSAFLSVLAPASLSFSATANAVRQRHELLTPVELMLLLHTSEKEMGLKQTIEAIGICFSMADGFRPEILAAFMTQVVDEPVIPVLFLRTVIQAVTTYKTLQPFVSTTLLTRLIAKKVWTTAPLWEGFIRLSKTIQPHSFGALLQLPKEQLLDVVTKQPTLREPLREYAVKKAGNSKAGKNSMAETLAVLGEVVEPVVAEPVAAPDGPGDAMAVDTAVA
ncbi:hypothetical protein RQP46_006623 [Phenoliferia psychrophenolica]